MTSQGHPFEIAMQEESLYFCYVCNAYLSGNMFQVINIKANVRLCRSCGSKRRASHQTKDPFVANILLNSHRWDRIWYGTSRKSLLTSTIVQYLCNCVFKWKSVICDRQSNQMILVRINPVYPLADWNCLLIHEREAKQMKDRPLNKWSTLIREIEGVQSRSTALRPGL
jgi:hypothetical protein